MELHVFEDLLKAQDENHLIATAERIVKRLGFDSFLYALVYRGQSTGQASYYTLGTYPEAWLHRYIEIGYDQIDPSIPYCLGNTTPLIWNSQIYGSPRLVEMNREAAEFGINAGGCIPLHTPWLPGVGVLSFSSGEDADRAAPYAAEIVGQVSLLAAFVNQAVRRLVLPPDMRFRLEDELTHRELECLRWCALGFSAKVVADRMGIAASTVNTQHLPEIRRKLRVRTTREAVVVALQYGLIQP